MATRKGTLLKLSATEFLYAANLGGVINNNDGTFTFYYHDSLGAPGTRTVSLTERDLQRIFNVVPVAS